MTPAEEICMLIDSIGFTNVEFAKLVGVSHVTVSRWRARLRHEKDPSKPKGSPPDKTTLALARRLVVEFKERSQRSTEEAVGSVASAEQKIDDPKVKEEVMRALMRWEWAVEDAAKELDRGLALIEKGEDPNFNPDAFPNLMHELLDCCVIMIRHGIMDPESFGRLMTEKMKQFQRLVKAGI